MATIGLSDLYYSTITEDTTGIETYATPVKLAKAMKADLSVELAEAVLYADDAASEVVKAFKNGTLSLGVDDIGKESAMALLGVRTDTNGVIVSASEDTAPPVAIGFKARKANGKYRYFWVYRVVFGVPSASLETKGDAVNFQTPTIEGTVTVRNKPDWQNKHPWKVEVTEGDDGVSNEVITDWFTMVYEPEGTALARLNSTGSGTTGTNSTNTGSAGSNSSSTSSTGNGSKTDGTSSTTGTTGTNSTSASSAGSDSSSTSLNGSESKTDGTSSTTGSTDTSSAGSGNKTTGGKSSGTDSTKS